MQRNTVWRRSMKRHSLNPALLASNLNRSPSFNSSGRSSNCDVEEVYSDISLEEDISDLSTKVESLERQVTALSDTHQQDDDRYSRSRQENGGLQARLLQAEDQLRELELRAAEQLDAEKRRHRDQVHRLQREQQLQLENMQLRVQCLEKEVGFGEGELSRLRQQLQDVSCRRDSLEQQLQQLNISQQAAIEEAKRAVELEAKQRQQLQLEQAAHAQALSELTRELEETHQSAHSRLRSDSDELAQTQTQTRQLEEEVRELRRQNNTLKETCDELHVQMLYSGVQEGRQLLQTSGTTSLADELQSIIPVDQVDSVDGQDKWKRAYLEQQEDNKQLRSYIDGILLNIVDHHPELLEVKQQSQH